MENNIDKRRLLVGNGSQSNEKLIHSSDKYFAQIIEVSEMLDTFSSFYSRKGFDFALQ